MREWLRLLAEVNVDPWTNRPAFGDAAAWATWTDVPRRALNTWNARRGASDFSLEVKEAMDGCLACKSCVGQCPIKVDVPAFRSRFLEVYHGRYLRPVKDGLVASLERWLPMAARAPRLINGLTGSGVGRSTLQRLGLVSLPELSTIDLQAALKQRGVADRIGRGLVAALRSGARQERHRRAGRFHVVLRHRHRPGLSRAPERLGFTPWLAPFKPNGKPQNVLGFLREFERTAAANADMLNALSATGVALVGVDPSMTLSYRAEYVKALGKERAPQVALPQEWLAGRIDQLPELTAEATSTWQLLPHCTEKTNAPAATADWVKVGRRLGVDPAGRGRWLLRDGGSVWTRACQPPNLGSDLPSQLVEAGVRPKAYRPTRRHRLFVPQSDVGDRWRAPASSTSGPAFARQGR